jgi:predicted RecA/RadA family phage recombinase
MAKNEIYRNANHLAFTVTAGVESGDLVVVGSLHGVAQIDRDASDGKATLWLDGGWELPVANGTYTEGEPIYAHAAGGTAPVSGEAVGLINDTATTGKLIGHSLESKTTTGGTGTLVVRLSNA